jgi:hypothetical protein
MSEEKFKQSRRPTNPMQQPLDPAAIMAKADEMERQNIERGIMPQDPMTKQMAGDVPFAMEGNVPPEFAALLKKDGKHAIPQTPVQGPKLAYTNNPKLNELLEGLKEKTATYEEARLPSLSKFYKNDEAPESGILHVRPMTGQEEEILGTQRFLKKGVAINMVFNNCVRERIQPEKWLTIDRTYLLMYLRGISVGTTYDVDIRCPNCAHRFETMIDLDQLLVNYCPKDYTTDNLHGVLPVTKYKFSFHLPTVHDEMLISNYRDNQQKSASEESIDDTFTWRTALLLEDIEGLNEHAALMTLLSKLPIGDVAYLRDVMNDIPFGTDTKIGQWCPSCQSDFEMEMPIEASFFFPQRKKAKRIPAFN